jgi:phosphatidylglycerol:prolipoprotein diacylglycerol transferase
MLRLPSHPEWHPILEGIGYVLGFAAFKHESRVYGDVLVNQQRWVVIAAAVVGALVGSRVLGLLDEFPLSSLNFFLLLTPSGGKTVVGGLLGGWLGVEITKKLYGIQTRTGDVFAIPLCIGIAVGRIGCLLAGLGDDTYGNPTSLWWGADFGDGIARHPTQAYEIVFLAALAAALYYIRRAPHSNGALFRDFMTAYLTWRLLVDGLKPRHMVDGLSIIQWACVVGLILLHVTWKRPSWTKVEKHA